MDCLDLKCYETEDISVEFHELPGADPCLVLRGAIEHPNPSVFLDPMFAELDDRLRAGRAHRLRIDLSALDFMNSSGIKSLIRYVMRLGERPTEDRYGITFVYAADVTWQYASLKAITLLSRGGATLVERSQGA